MKKTVILLAIAFAAAAGAGQLKIGWGKADVTPSGPTMLQGQKSNRLSTRIIDRLSVTALALEKDGTGVIMFSLDHCGLKTTLLKAVRSSICKKIGVKPESIIGFVTHTHTAPKYGGIVPVKDSMKLKLADKKYETLGIGLRGVDIAEVKKQYPDFVDCEMYFDILVKRITDAAVQAWKNRTAGKIAFGMGSAAIGECRRLTMSDRGGVMYGQENDPAFMHAEGHVDNSLNILATYTPCGKLTGVVVNLACPSQVSEAMSVVSADFWNEVRERVAIKYGKDVHILPQCSAAGDISPHKIMNRRADERMMLLKQQQKKRLPDWQWKTRVYDLEYGLARRREIARRIMTGLDDVLPVIASTARGDVVFKHSFRTVVLPPRVITKAEAEAAAKDAKVYLERMKKNGSVYEGSVLSQLGVVERYKNPPKAFKMELHTIRLDDMVFATNPFELYLDYGDRIKGGSRAVQTFLIQLANGTGGYLPSRRSGTRGYGSWPSSVSVNFDGGNIVVRETLKDINALF